MTIKKKITMTVNGSEISAEIVKSFILKGLTWVVSRARAAPVPSKSMTRLFVGA